MDEGKDIRIIPPADIDAEMAVLGAMLKNQDAVADVIEILQAEDFYLKEHQEIYAAMYEMARRSVAIDLMTTYSELKSRKTAELVGGLTYLSKLIEDTIVAANAKYYAAIVSDKSKMRMLIKEAEGIRESAYSDELTPTDILDNAERRIMDIANKTQKSKYVDINDILVENMSELRELAKNKGRLPGIATGFKSVDKILGGIQKTNLVILAARPGVGKTAFALNIATNAAMAGNKVMVFSLEMSNGELGQRVMSMTAKVPLENLKRGDLTGEDWDAISDAHDRFEKVDFVIDESTGITPVEMKNKCRRFKNERGGLDLIVIDYLQLMSMGGYKTDNRVAEISALTRAIKLLAKELDVAVILLSQLSRGPEQRADHKPQLADLRDSGSIEQDADVVIFLRRPDYYQNSEDAPANTDSSTGLICQVNIAKHRNGAVGETAVAWIPIYTEFGNLASNYDGERQH